MYSTHPDWSRFFAQFRRDVKLWACCVGFFLIYRISFIAWFHDHIAPSSRAADIWFAVFGGLRYDSVVAFYWIVLPLVLSLMCGFVDITRANNWIRQFIAALFMLSMTVVSFVAFGFFAEFGDIFNETLFNTFYDDAGAIGATIAAEYPLVLLIAAALVFIVGGWILIRWILRTDILYVRIIEKSTQTTGHRVAITIAALLFVMIAARGSAGKRPVQRLDGAITTDPFLNKAVFNPIYALKSAYKDHRLILSATGLDVFLHGEDLKDALTRIAPPGAPVETLDDVLVKHAKGPKGNVPRHIFVIVGESYDSWPTLEKYRALHMTDEMQALGDSGILVRSFLPASGRTMWSLGALFTGLADAGVYTNYQPASLQTYPSAAAAIFRELGYRTRLFYGGYLSWQRTGEFATAQGFEETYGAAHIGLEVENNTWGVDDEYLYDFVLNAVNDSTPSFNLILTTTYHLPFDIDVYGRGYPVHTVPPELQDEWDGSVELEWLGHLWYSDRQLGRFIRTMNARLPHAVFAATGDHASHLYINAQRGFYEKSSVPLLLYGPSVLDSVRVPREIAGSHLDIVPTMIELAAPAGFTYHAIGSDLLDTLRAPLGFGRGKVIGPDFIVDLTTNPSIFPIPPRDAIPSSPDIDALRDVHDAMHAASWWRIMHGNQLNESEIAIQR